MSYKADFAFENANRLSGANEYGICFKKGVRRNTPFFLLITHKNNLHIARLGMSLPKKKFPKAHDRNRIKRIIRETFRLNKSILIGLDLVILPHPLSRNTESKIISQSLIQQFKTKVI